MSANYSVKVLTQRGSLSKVWLVGHGWDKGISKKDVQHTSIEDSVRDIVSPGEPLGLRISGQLLLGIVRIFEKKMKYLQEDASHALAKIKLSFRPSTSLNRNEDIDASDKERQAQVSRKEKSITLPTRMGEIDVDLEFLDLPLEHILEEMEMSGELNEDLDVEWKLREAQSERGSQRMSFGQSFNESLDLEMPRDAPLDFGPELELAPMNLDLKSLPEASISVRDFEGASMPSITMDNPFGEEPSLNVDFEESLEVQTKERRKRTEKFDRQTQINSRKYTSEVSEKLLVQDKSESIRERLEKESNTFSVDSIEQLEVLLKSCLGVEVELEDSLKRYFEQDTPVIQQQQPVTSHDYHGQSQSIHEHPSFLSDEGFGDVSHLAHEVDHVQLDQVDMVPEMSFDPSFHEEGQLAYEASSQTSEMAPFTAPAADESEAGWSERTKKAFELISSRIESSAGSSVSLQEMVEFKPKRAAAVLFHEVLVLKSRGMLNLEQSSDFAPIQLSLA